MGRLQAVFGNHAYHRIYKMKTDIFPTLTKLTGFKTPAPKPAAQYIDLTPTWEGIMPALIAAAANNSKAAIEELTRLARTVDQMNAKLKGAK